MRADTCTPYWGHLVCVLLLPWVTQSAGEAHGRGRNQKQQCRDTSGRAAPDLKSCAAQVLQSATVDLPSTPRSLPEGHCFSRPCSNLRVHSSPRIVWSSGSSGLREGHTFSLFTGLSHFDCSLLRQHFSLQSSLASNL